MNIRNQTCNNPHCVYHGKNDGNVLIHSRKLRRFQCKACKKTWVEHIHNDTFRLHVSPENLNKALDLLSIGMSIRQTAQEMKVSPSTIARWKKRFL